MITGVIGQSDCNGKSEPSPSCRNVQIEYVNAQKRRKQIGNDVFDWMSVNGDYCDRSSPFVMLLVDVFVESFVMQSPGRKTIELKMKEDKKNSHSQIQ